MYVVWNWRSLCSSQLTWRWKLIKIVCIFFTKFVWSSRPDKTSCCLLIYILSLMMLFCHVRGAGGSTIMTEIFVIFSSTFNGWQQSLEVGLHVFITETERLYLFKNFISDEQKGCWICRWSVLLPSSNLIFGSPHHTTPHHTTKLIFSNCF